MSIHPPKYLTNTDGLGIAANTRSMRYISDTTGIGTEVWARPDTPWKEGEVVIADAGYTWKTKWEQGKRYLITKFYTHTDTLVGIYCDVGRPVARTKNGFAFVDLYLDVWQVADENPVLLDEDELVAAVQAGYISALEADEAHRVSNYLMEALLSQQELTNF